VVYRVWKSLGKETAQSLGVKAFHLAKLGEPCLQCQGGSRRTSDLPALTPHSTFVIEAPDMGAMMTGAGDVGA
jgi:hypothetical protein